MVGLETEYGNRPDAMAYILGTALMPELGQTRARELVGMYQSGRFSTSEIQKFMQEKPGPTGGPESAADVALARTAEDTATFMRFKDVNDAYLDTILEFGGEGGLDSLNSINKALRDFQIALASVSANVANLDTIKTILDAIASVSGGMGLPRSPDRTVLVGAVPVDGTRNKNFNPASSN